jgi:hypothetical protein
MKIISLLLLAMLGSAGGATPAGTYHYTCKSSKDGKCPPPPVPPMPPMPPMAPLPPVPPAPPAPPPAPVIPDVPAAAHAACADKRAGSAITYILGKGESMTGTCESEAGKMLFILRSYALED